MATSIRFPQRHIADSVTRRIQEFARQQDAQTNKVAAQSAQLDAALSAPVGDVAPMEGIEDTIVLKSLGI